LLSLSARLKQSSEEIEPTQNLIHPKDITKREKESFFLPSSLWLEFLSGYWDANFENDKDEWP